MSGRRFSLILLPTLACNADCTLDRSGCADFVPTGGDDVTLIVEIGDMGSPNDGGGGGGVAGSAGGPVVVAGGGGMAGAGGAATDLDFAYWEFFQDLSG